MNKQVEQIKAEIERLKKWCEEHTTESYSCYFDAFNDIDTFINSLEEEFASKVWHTKKEKPNGKDYVLCYDAKFASVGKFDHITGCSWAYVKDLYMLS